MQTRITRDEMQAAARQLVKTVEGRAALQQLLTLLESDIAGLDLLNQRAFLALLGGVWTGQGATARETARAALDEANR